MRNRLNNRGTIMGVVAVTAFMVLLAVQSVPAQDYRAPRTADGRPDLNGIWQAVGAAHYDLEPHAADFSPSLEMGALGGVAAGLGVVVGGEIPYRQEALAQRVANRENQLLYDPAVRCYMPGIPRATLQPFPFQIVQTPEYILFAYEFASASRIVYMNRPDFEAPADAWMGHSRGTWDGETLVIDVTSQVPETWLDRSGNYHSNSIRVEERVHRDQRVSPPVRGDHHRSRDLRAAVDHPDAASIGASTRTCSCSSSSASSSSRS